MDQITEMYSYVQAEIQNNVHQDLASDLSEIRIEPSWRSNNWTVETRFSSDEKKVFSWKVR